MVKYLPLTQKMRTFANDFTIKGTASLINARNDEAQGIPSTT
jgi:hypothetical protein